MSRENWKENISKKWNNNIVSMFLRPTWFMKIVNKIWSNYYSNMYSVKKGGTYVCKYIFLTRLCVHVINLQNTIETFPKRKPMTVNQRQRFVVYSLFLWIHVYIHVHMLVTKSTHVIISFQMTVETTTNAHALSTNSSKSTDAVEVSATTLLVPQKYGTFYFI